MHTHTKKKKKKNWRPTNTVRKEADEDAERATRWAWSALAFYGYLFTKSYDNVTFQNFLFSRHSRSTSHTCKVVQVFFQVDVRFLSPETRDSNALKAVRSRWWCFPPKHNRPLSFISLSHSDNQSESATKFYNSFKADVGGNVLTLT